MEREYELQTHRVEDRHWWYRGRRNVIDSVLQDLPAIAGSRVLDAGCGSGRNMVELARYGQVTGVELSPRSVALARSREVGEVLECSVMAMPFPDGHFNLATSLDVIEHLEDDVGAMRELRRVVAPGGHLLITVPSYQWLWSGHDVLNQHRRRYSERTLLATSAAAGWSPVFVTHFNALLLPVAIVLRALDRFTKATESSLDLWVPPRPLNWALAQPLNLEAAAIARGRSIPAGLSLLALLR